MENNLKVSVVVVGDSKIGKTALIRQFTNKTFTEDYVPTNFDKLNTIQEVEQRRVEFVIWDTSGSPAHDSVRALSYQDADVFLLCYKISDPDSLYNVKNKWIREIRSQKFNNSHQPPVVLCGCQADQRTDPQTLAALGKIGRMPTSSEQALAICCEIGAVNYVETSSIPDEVGKHYGYEGAREAFEVCALAVKKISALSANTITFSPAIRENSAATSNKENKALKSNQGSKRKSILLSPSKMVGGQHPGSNFSQHNTSIGDHDLSFSEKERNPLGMSTTSSRKSNSSNTSSHASKKSSSFSGHNVSFGSACGLKNEIDSISEYPTFSSMSSKVSGENNIPCQYVSVHSHQELHQASMNQNENIDCKDGSIVKMIHNDGSFSNLPKLPYYRNTNSPKLKNRSFKDNFARNMSTASNKSMKDIDHHRLQNRAMSFGSSHSSFSGSSPFVERLSVASSTNNTSSNVFLGSDENTVPIRIESDDIIMLSRANVAPLRGSQDMNPMSSFGSQYSQQNQQAQVRANGLSRRTSFRSQSQTGKSMSIPVSTPKSPLSMNGDVTIHVASQAQETKSQPGAQPGPQVAPILKRSANSFNSSSNNFKANELGMSELRASSNIHLSSANQNASKQSDSILQYKPGLTSTLASQGSAGSKTSTTSSVASTSTKESNFHSALGVSKQKIPVISENVDVRDTQDRSKPNHDTDISSEWLNDVILDTQIPNIDDPNVLNQLQFVSPKTGVFRPVVESNSVSSSVRKSMSLGRGVKLKKNNACSVM